MQNIYDIIEQENIPCEILVGIDGGMYAVFSNGMEAEEWGDYFEGYQLVCYGQYENAYRIG